MAEETGERTFTLDLPANANSQGANAPRRSRAFNRRRDVRRARLSDRLPIRLRRTDDVQLPAERDSRADVEGREDGFDQGVERSEREGSAGLDRLCGFQHGDGGWGWWKDDKTDPFMTAYVVDGLTMARRAGYAVNGYALNRGRESVKHLLDAGKLENGKPIDPESRAYLVYALNVSGAPERSRSALRRRPVCEARRIAAYGRALLALALKSRGDDNRARQVVSELEREARVTDFDAHWESVRRPMLDFSEENDLEATALSVKALAQVNPQSVLLAKAARWLVANRRNGYYWESTKHTAFAILALSDYLKVSRELSADYTVEVYLNGKQVLASRVTAAEAAAETDGRRTQGRPDRRLQSGAGGQARLGRALRVGDARLLHARGEHRVAIVERFEAGARIPAAARDRRRRQTELEGGAAFGRTAFRRPDRGAAATTGRARAIPDGRRPDTRRLRTARTRQRVNLDYGDGRWSDWYNNREFRDQRTVIFTDYFDGDATFQYAMRVLTPGDFKVAPARAELMYQPTVQANTANVKLNILDKCNIPWERPIPACLLRRVGASRRQGWAALQEFPEEFNGQRCSSLNRGRRAEAVRQLGRAVNFALDVLGAVGRDLSFFTIREATATQVALNLVLPIAAVALFFLIQAMGLSYTRIGVGAAYLLKRSLGDCWRICSPACR